MAATAAPRLAVRAVIVENGRLLLVNAFAGRENGLWCAPGGGAEVHASLPENLAREVHEETGLTVAVGRLLAICEFHDPSGDFHQVDMFFAATITAGQIAADWRDPDGVVSHRRWFSPGDLATAWFKPAILPQLAFGPSAAPLCHPLEQMVT